MILAPTPSNSTSDTPSSMSTPNITNVSIPASSSSSSACSSTSSSPSAVFAFCHQLQPGSLDPMSVHNQAIMANQMLHNALHIQTAIGFDVNGMPVSMPMSVNGQVPMALMASSASPASSVAGQSMSDVNVSPSGSSHSKSHFSHRVHHGHPHHSQQQHVNTNSIAEYLQQLIKERAKLTSCPGMYVHCERLIDVEVARVRALLFTGDEKKPLELPAAEGEVITKTEKVYVPVDEYPEYNFVGRILGPRGLTAKQLEQETGCKIMVRGRGSMRDKKKDEQVNNLLEEQNRGKPNWEHLNDNLHVLITVEDTENRAMLKMQRAIEEIKKLLVPVVDGEDELKKRQLMELAIMNGTYRDSAQRNLQQLGLDAEQLRNLALSNQHAVTAALRHQQQQQLLSQPAMLMHRHQYAAGQQHHAASTQATLLNGNALAGGQPGSLIAGSDGSLIYAPAAGSPYAPPEYHPGAFSHAAAGAPHPYQLLDYGAAVAAAAAAAAAAGTPVIDTSGSSLGKEKRARLTNRFHPYDTLCLQRATT